MESTWETREIPVLTATVDLFEEAGNIMPVTVQEIAARSQLEPADVFNSLMAMKDVYVEVRLVLAGGNPNPHMVTRVSSEARRLVGQWPTPEALTDRVIAELTAAANAEPDPEKKSSLRVFADAAASVGRDVLVNVMTALIVGAH